MQYSHFVVVVVVVVFCFFVFFKEANGFVCCF